MIQLFDTSALILAARHDGAAEALREAMGGGGPAVTDIVVVEYLNGARNLAEYDRFAWSLGEARRLRAEPADWDRICRSTACWRPPARTTSDPCPCRT